jgi:hypothetical protein
MGSSLHQGAVDIGQGPTVVTQIAADAVGLPIELIDLGPRIPI